MASVRKSVYISSVFQYYSATLGLTRVVVLSRLLSAEDFGVFAIAMSFINFARVFRNFGVWDYIVSSKKLSDDQLRICFTIVLFSSIIFSVLFIIFADLVGDIYKSNQLTSVLYLITVSFLLSPFGAVSQALMHRGMQFGRLFVIQFATSTVGVVLSIVLASLGFGVMSLAWGFVAASFVMVCMVLIMDRRHFVFRPVFRNSRSIMQFGGLSTLADFMAEVIMFAPSLVAGIALSLGDVGHLGRGQALINFIQQGIERSVGLVSRSWFAATSRDDPARLKENYLKATVIICAIAWPAYLSLIFLAPQIIPFFLGGGWERSIAVTQILCIGGLFSIHGFLGLHLVTGMGQVRKRVRANFFGCAAIVLALAGFASLGIRSVALSVVFSQVALFGATVHILSGLIGIGFSDIIRSSAPTAGVSILAISPLLLLELTGWSMPGSDMVALGFAFGSVAIFWICGLWLFQHPLRRELLLVLKFKGKSTL